MAEPAAVCPHCECAVEAEALPGAECVCAVCALPLVFTPAGWEIAGNLWECLFCNSIVGSACPMVARGEIPAHGGRPCQLVALRARGDA